MVMSKSVRVDGLGIWVSVMTYLVLVVLNFDGGKLVVNGVMLFVVVLGNEF